MPSVLVRNIPDETHRALKHLAKQHGRSTTAEILSILENTVNPRARIQAGTELAALRHLTEGLDFDAPRDKTPARAASFE